MPGYRDRKIVSVFQGDAPNIDKLSKSQRQLEILLLGRLWSQHFGLEVFSLILYNDEKNSEACGSPDTNAKEHEDSSPMTAD